MGSLLFRCLTHTIGFRQQPRLSAVWPLVLLKETTATSRNTSWSIIVVMTGITLLNFLKMCEKKTTTKKNKNQNKTRTLSRCLCHILEEGRAFHSHKCHDPTTESTTFTIPGVALPGRSENTAPDHGPCRTGMRRTSLQNFNIYTHSRRLSHSS